ncbi:MAG TPA: TonB-dependent receptor [Gemmatimonadales bacterium]|nr:TonB-dependent receptor [Gemmatimonadales bacterium]
MTYRAALLVTLLGLPAETAAQEPRDSVELEPVVVTATRVPLPRDAVAAAVTVITADELRRRGIRTVAEALRAIPAATVVETGSVGGLTELYVRGGESDYVKVLLDGVPLNQPGGTFDFANLTIDNVERIEIVRGPTSVLYGSDAVTGVIQLFTRAGSGPPTVTAAMRGGLGERFDRPETATSLEYSVAAHGSSGPVRYGLSAAQFRTPGWYSFNNDYRNTVVSGRVRVVPDARTDAGITYRFTDARNHFPTDFAGQPVDSTQWSTERGPTFGLEAGRRLTGTVEARVLAGLRETRQGYSNPPFESRDLVRRETWGALVNWRRGAAAVITAGVEYEKESQYGSIRARRTNAAYYAQGVLGVNRALTGTFGARLEDNSAFGTHVTYRAGASYRLRDATRIRGSLGTGFKEPLLIENYGGFGTVGNPKLSPERSTSWELGVELAVRGTPVTLSLTYFDQAFRDLIVFDFNRTPNYANLGRVDARGAEVEAQALTGPLFASIGYTYVETRVLQGAGSSFESGKRLLRRPGNRAEAGVGYRFGERASVRLEARFVGDRDDVDYTTFQRVTLHPYTRLNLLVDYELVHPRGLAPGFTVNARLENLASDDAREIANFPARRRTLLFGGQVRFGS